MSASPTDRRDSARQAFADQFERNGTNLVYRRSQKGEAISVSAAERSKFIDEFDRNARRASWIIYIVLTLVVAGIITFSLLSGSDLSEGAFFVGIGLAMIPYFAFYRWAWAAPARELAGRTPIAGERSSEEVQRIRFRRMTYGQLAGAAFGGLAIPFIGSSRQNLLSGWNRVWLVFGAALVLVAAVQAFRKWRFQQEDSYKNVIPQSHSRDAAEPLEDENSPTTGRFWRYVPLAVILLALAFVTSTPTGKQLAKNPSFWSIAIIGCGGWSLFTVARALAKGQIEPFARGFYNTYQRETQPKRFWASVAWNAIFGCACLGLAFVMTRDGSAEAVQDHCYNQHSEVSERESFSACTELIEGRARLTYLTVGDAYVYRAIADENLGDRGRAEADYTQAIRLKPSDGYAFLNRGLIFLGTMRLDQAVTDFSRAHEIDPKSPWPIANRGMAYAWKNDRARAEADFAAVRAIDPANIVVRHGEGVLNMNAGNLEAAIEDFTAALRQDPSDAWSVQMRADAHQQMGEFEKAREDRAKLLEMRRSRVERSPASN
jgi:tetratricopeptide (TPR) repeat protein